MTRPRLHSKSLSSPLGSIDEEGDSVLDEFILDDSYSADMAGARFDSQRQHQQAHQPQQHFFTPTPSYPQQDDTWSTYAAHNQTQTFNTVNTPQTLSYAQLPVQSQLSQRYPPQYSSYNEHPPSWQPLSVSTTQHDGASSRLPFPYEIKSEEPIHESNMMPSDALIANVPHEPTQQVPSIASPQSDNGWLSTSSSSEHSKNPAKTETIARSFTDFPSHMRREGIRKKNARVEIPDGRTIDSIEEEIRLCDPNDEEKLKRLKQYKRLLRNREAAYDEFLCCLMRNHLLTYHQSILALPEEGTCTEAGGGQQGPP